MEYQETSRPQFCHGHRQESSGAPPGLGYVQVQPLEIPAEGLVVQLKQMGRVKVFRRRFKNEQYRYYLVFLADRENLWRLVSWNFAALR